MFRIWCGMAVDATRSAPSPDIGLPIVDERRDDDVGALFGEMLVEVATRLPTALRLISTLHS